ncbi:TPA: Vir protein, partial [Legionella pneumophila]|nr:Vir protein [Legionella pneumophila]
MDFLFVTTYELDALSEIPLMQRVVYLMGIRP